MRDRIVGKHVFGECYASREPTLEELKNLVAEAAKVSNATLHEVFGYDLDVKLFACALVLESHICVSFYKYSGWLVIDVYTCGEHTEPKKGFNLIIERLRAYQCRVRYTDRSQQ